MTPRRIARGIARRLGLKRIWIPAIRPYRLVQHGKEFIPCHGCGATQYRVFIRDPLHQVVRCTQCGLYYVNPVPSEAMLSRQAQDSRAYTDDQLFKLKFFERRARRLFERIDNLRCCGRLLDIGCAIGTELAVGKERGWIVTGIELAESSVRIGREAGFDIRSVPLIETRFATGSFDLITMNHVLEH